MGKAELGKAMMSLRPDAHRHLREVAACGWFFWDIFTFREWMARLRVKGP